MAAAVIQRPYRGSRVSTFYPVKNLPPLSSLDSAFQLQEYISLLIRHDVHDVERIVALPGKSNNKDKDKEGEEISESLKNDEKEVEKTKGDVTVDEACWIYEQLRRLAQDLTHPLITMLQQECSRTTCPEMKAGEWLYLCVAHGTDGAMEQCCAIDYILHTLDSATALLNSPRAFPSRLQIPPASHRHFSSLARRLGRIFAHAYFHHRDIFAQAEAESSLYARFLALTSRYDLVPADFIVIPSTKVVTSTGEGEEGDIPRDSVGKGQKTSIIIPDSSEVQPPRLLAAAIDPQGEKEKDKGLQRPTSAPPSNAPFNSTSVRVISSRNNKTRNPPGLFVGGSGLIPVSAAATAAPTTAASLFESTEIPLTSNPNQTLPSTTTSTTLAPGQESPRKPGRPRTDTMIYSEDSSLSGNGIGSGVRGTSPTPVIRLGTRLNEPKVSQEPQPLVDVEPKAVVSTQLIGEPEPYVIDESLETGPAASAVGEQPKVDNADVSAPDFEPIDYEMVVGGQESSVEEPVVQSLPSGGEEGGEAQAALATAKEPAHVEEPSPIEEKTEVEEQVTGPEAPGGEQHVEVPSVEELASTSDLPVDPAPASAHIPELEPAPQSEEISETAAENVVDTETAASSEEAENSAEGHDKSVVIVGEEKETEVTEVEKTGVDSGS